MAAVALVVAGCGGGGSSSSGTTTPTTSAVSFAAPTTAVVPSTTSTSATPTTDPALVAKATAALFQPGDFPPDFKAQNDNSGDCPASDDNCASLHLEVLWKDLTGCLGVDDSSPSALATSATYKRGIATQARTTIEYTTPAKASAIMDALASPKFQGCLIPAFTADAHRSAPSGATIGKVTILPFTFPTVGQRSSATRVTVNIEMGFTIVTHQDLIVAVNGGTLVRFFFLNPGSPFPPTLEQSLVQKVVARAA